MRGFRVLYAKGDYCGYTKENLLNQPVDMIFNEDDRLRITNGSFQDKLLRMGRASDTEVFLRPEDIRRSNIPISLTASLMRDKEGAPLGTVYIGRIFAGRKQVEVQIEDVEVAVIKDNEQDQETIVAANKMISEEGKKSNKQSTNEILAEMIHEIREPIKAVMGNIRPLLKTELTEKQQDHLEAIRVNAESLLMLVNDVLEFSQIESGKLELDKVSFDLRTAVEDVAGLLAPKAYEKGLEFGCIINSEVPSWVVGDPGRLRQILIALAENAIKLTKKGEVVIAVDIEAENTTQVTVRFVLKDTGVDDLADHMDQLFNSSNHIDSEMARKYEESGFGLAAFRKLIEAMGGRSGCESEKGKGSTFWFTIALNKQPEVEESFPALPTYIKKKRILAVDDNAANLEVFCNYLEFWGFQYDTASNTREALSLLRSAVDEENPFHLAILNHSMPNMDAESLGREIMADAALKDTLLVMLTSRGLRGDAARASEIGFSAYITKPIKQSQLYDCLLTVFGEGTEGRGHNHLITRHTLAEARKRKVRILIAEDNAVNQNLILRLMEKIGYRADAVANGKGAIKAVETTPYDLVLLDIQMPDMDGFETALFIREQEKQTGRRVPIVAMTEHSMKIDRERCEKSGIDDCVSKPIHPQELYDVVEKQVEPWGGEVGSRK